MYQRNLKQSVLEALGNSPVVLITGARQTGKSTFVQTLLGNDFPEHYQTLDDPLILSAAKSSPAAFIERFPEKTALDEIQRVPELLLAIKKSVDENRKPGRFLLTGSANILTLPKVAESLAGRMEIHPMWPLSAGEIRGRKERFIDALFAPHLPRIAKTKR